MRRSFAYGAALAQGTWPCQEDGFLVDPSRRLYAVADGFGGKGAGDLAAKLALAELRRESSAGEGSEPSRSEALRRRLEAANKQILERNRARAPGQRGGASVIAAHLSDTGALSLVHTGAGAAFLWRTGKLVPLLLPQASLREEFQALLPDQALGLGETLQLESRGLSLVPGDLLFLASSGVDWETPAFQRALAAALRTRRVGQSLEPLLRSLVENASLAAQGWNRTLVAAERL